MKIIIWLIILSFFSSCLDNNSVKIESDKSLKYPETNIMDTINKEKWHNYSSVKRDINRLYKYIEDFSLNKNRNLKQFIQDIPVSPAAFIAASLANEEIVDEIVIMFYLKVYKNNLLGNDYMYNLSCNSNSNAFVLLFVQHFYKISNYDPTIGLLSKDVYNWARKENKFINKPNFELLFNEIDSLEIKRQK